MKQYKVIVGPKGQTVETYSVSVNAKSQKAAKIAAIKVVCKEFNLNIALAKLNCKDIWRED